MKERVLFRKERRMHPKEPGRWLNLQGTVRSVLVNTEDTPDFPRLWTDGRGVIYREDFGGIFLAWDVQGRDYYSLGRVPDGFVSTFGGRFEEAKLYARSLAPRRDDFYRRVSRALGPTLKVY